MVLEGAGKCSIFLYDMEPVTFESHVTRVRLDPHDADPLSSTITTSNLIMVERRYVALWNREQEPQAFVEATLQKLDVQWHPVNEQRAIAHILGTLDDKIDLNKRMNETLESMSWALFKSWFGNLYLSAPKPKARTPNLTKPFADFFPDSFEDSELGEIPKGWKVGTVDEEFNLTMGQSPPGESYNEAREGLPFFQGRADFGFRFPSQRVFCTAPTRFAEAGDTLISVRAPVGDINMANMRCCIGRGVAAARHKTGSCSYTYYFMRSLEESFERFEAEGTVFGSINKKDFHNIQSIRPSAEVIKAFERVAQPIDDKIAINDRASHTLAALREVLLQKLVSGDLRLKDSTRFLGRGDS